MRKLFSGVVIIREPGDRPGYVYVRNNFFTVLATSQDAALGMMVAAARKTWPTGPIENTYVYEIDADTIRAAYRELNGEG